MLTPGLTNRNQQPVSFAFDDQAEKKSKIAFFASNPFAQKSF